MMRLRLTTLLILTSSFSVIFGVLLAGQNLQRILTLWGDSLQMTVYLSENASPAAATELETSLKNSDQIDKVQFVSKENALSQFREQMASYAPNLMNDSELLKMIPASYQFSVSKKVPVANQLGVMEDIAKDLKTKAGVDEVSYGQDWVKSYSQLTQLVSEVGIVFTFVIIACALFVISNCIRSSIYQRKEEIEVLELIGATSRFIRRPFIVEGVSLCFGAALIGIFVSFGFFTTLKESMNSQLSLLQLAQHIQFLNPVSILVILCGAGAVGWIAAELCLRSLNDGWAASRQKAKVEHE